MLNLIKECLEGTDYDTIKIGNDYCSISEFFENVKGDFLVIAYDDRKKLINLKTVKEIHLLNQNSSKITAIHGLNL